MTPYKPLYPPQAVKRLYRTATVQIKLTLAQELPADRIGLETLKLQKSDK